MVVSVKSVLTYTGLRLALLVATGGLAYALGMRGLLLLITAFLVSGILSIFVLRPQRAGFSDSVTGLVRRVNDRIDAAARAEDDDEPLEAGLDAGGPGEPASTERTETSAPRSAAH